MQAGPHVFDVDRVDETAMITASTPEREVSMAIDSIISAFFGIREQRGVGGTLIFDVPSLAAHMKRLDDPDGYRPRKCPRCGHDVLHLHSYPVRRPRGERPVRIARYICARDGCKATWRVLPSFLAARLQRSWAAVEAVVIPGASESPAATPVPERTARRYRSRFAAGARALVLLLAVSNIPAYEGVSKRARLDATHAELLLAHEQEAQTRPGQRLEAMAHLVHELHIRLKGERDFKAPRSLRRPNATAPPFLTAPS
jgi:hypothetical protein